MSSTNDVDESKTNLNDGKPYIENKVPDKPKPGNTGSGGFGGFGGGSSGGAGASGGW